MSFADLEASWKTRRERVTAFLKEIGQEYPRCGYDVGDGWSPHVEKALLGMSKVEGISWRLEQVKQKFCQLRIYYDVLAPREGDNWIYKPEHSLHAKYQELEAFVRVAEEACDRACEECGAECPPGPASGRKECEPCSKKPRGW